MIAYLLKLDVNENNNRYYKMIHKEDSDIFEIEYGRVGATPMKLKRPMSLWQYTYNSHINEGYVDRTRYLQVKEEGGFAPIKDKQVGEMIDFLLSCTNEVLKRNYTISYKEVSQKMIQDAQELLFQMYDNPSLPYVQEKLPELFMIIPRKMNDVNKELPEKKEEIPILLAKEQDLLDAMRSKVSDEEQDRPVTILEAHGLDITLVTDQEEILQIRKYMKKDAVRFNRAFRVRNKATDERFKEYMHQHGLSKKHIHYLYHGSKNENYWGLIKQGPLLNPKAQITGKMFGYGLYFANKAEKSIKYTSIKGSYWAKGNSDIAYLAVYKVVYKNPFHVYYHKREMCSYTRASIQEHDALFAHGGFDLFNDEIIVYDESQVSLQYLIEIRKG